MSNTSMFNFECFEELVRTADELKTAEAEDNLHLRIRHYILYETMYFAPGWAKEHNEWFMEQLKDIPHLFVSICSLDEREPVPIEAECQREGLRKVLDCGQNAYRIADCWTGYISQEECLWRAYELHHFNKDNIKRSSVKDFIKASTILDGKPIVKEYDLPLKNALVKAFHGDPTSLQPFVDCEFNGLHDEDLCTIRDTLLTLSIESLSVAKTRFSKMLRELVLQSPSRTLVNYILKSDPEKGVAVRALRLIDFNELVVCDPRLVVKVLEKTRCIPPQKPQSSWTFSYGV